MSNSPPPRVSVIIPLYNKVDYIERTIESVLEQDFRDFEIIVVDDGSADGSSEIAARYADEFGERIRYVRQERAGAGAARNRGMELAGGEFLAFLDADDLWIPEKLTRQTRFMEDHADVEWCATNYWVKQGTERESRAAVPYRTAPSSDGWILVDWFSGMAEGDVSFQTSGVMLRRRLVERAGQFDVTIPSGQDFDYWVRIAEITPICGYCLSPCYTFSRDSLYSITFNEERKYAGKVEMLTRFMKRSTLPDSTPAYEKLIRFVSERIVRGAISEGHRQVARKLLRNFPAHWRSMRYQGYMLLTHVPAPVLRLIGRFTQRRVSGRLQNSRGSIE